MRDSRPIEHAPLGFGNRALLADCQRDDDARVSRVGERGHDAVTHRRPRALDVIARPSGKRRDPRIGRVVADVACRTDAVLEQPRLDIESVRIDRAVRALHPDGQPPALAGDERRHVIGRAVLALLREPRQRDQRRHVCVRGLDPLDGEREAGAACGLLRDAVDHADERNVPALPFRRERISEPAFGAPCGVAESKCTGGRDDERHGQHASIGYDTHRFAQRPCDRSRHGRARKPRRARGKRRLPLQQDGTGGECGEGIGQRGHGDRARAPCTSCDSGRGTRRSASRPRSRGPVVNLGAARSARHAPEG